MVAMVLTNYISQGATRTRRNRVLSAQFGDGYSQEAPDGTNAITDEWALAFENLNTSERATLWGMLDAVGSWGVIEWTAPGDSTAKKWKVTQDGASEVPISGELYSVSFTIRQVF